MRVLFIGNSFTARNDLPSLVAERAQARGERLEHAIVWAGGASLRRHWNAGEAAALIASSPWDVVVLQEQSTLPIKSPERFHESAALFDEAIRAAGARTALYMTWARRHAPESWVPLVDAYLNTGLALDAFVVPVGEAWARHPDPDSLYDRDGSHPSLEGSRLAAAVFAEAFWGSSPYA
ncbi:MAG TPA: hypothetical protein VEA99_02765 [Gemmatimonadaceae bacterium]|nr:hypothetical protein [Gemmatimonadaceae bacterium]